MRAHGAVARVWCYVFGRDTRMTLTVKMPPYLSEKLQALAAKRQVSPEECVLAAVEDFLGQEDATSEKLPRTPSEALADWERNGILGGTWARKHSGGDALGIARELRHRAQTRDRD